MTTTSSEREKPLPRFALFGGLTLLIALWLPLFLSLPRVLFKESDIFWMLATGRRILETHALPVADSFSSNTTSGSWIVYQWLSDVLFTLASVIGFKGVECFGAALIALIFSVMIFRRSIKLGARSLMTLVATGLACAALYPDFATLRPQLFSYIFLFSLQTIAEDCWVQPKSLKASKRTFVKVAVIGILWANFHISFPLGAMLLALYLVVAVVLQVAKRDKDFTRIKFYASLIGIFVFSTLANPYLIGLWLFIPRLNNMFVTQEMMPLVETKHLFWFASLLMLALLMSTRVASARVLLALVLFDLGVMHVHLMTYFCLSTLPLISESLSKLAAVLYRFNWLSRLDRWLAQTALARLYPPVIVTSAALVIAFAPLLVPTDVPVAAADYFDGHPVVSGNLFNSQSAGNYLIYRYNGSVKVFMDTRFDLYDRKFCEGYFGALQGKGWEEFFQQHNVKTTLLPNNIPLNICISQDPAWTLVYKDDYFSIYQCTTVHS